MGAERAQKKAAAGVAWRKGSSGAVGVWGTEERALPWLEDGGTRQRGIGNRLEGGGKRLGVKVVDWQVNVSGIGAKT